MSDAINLSRMRDAAFTAEVEAHSGQNVSTCYQCGNCTAGCPAGFVYDPQASQIMRAVQLGLKDMVLDSSPSGCVCPVLPVASAAPTII